MTNQDVQMPLFGKAGNSALPHSDWVDSDHFDVEMLADYLLDDATGPSITFDFNHSALAGSSVVSPENSVNGVHSNVAEPSTTASQSTQPGASSAPGTSAAATSPVKTVSTSTGVTSASVTKAPSENASTENASAVSASTANSPLTDTTTTNTTTISVSTMSASTTSTPSKTRSSSLSNTWALAGGQSGMVPDPMTLASSNPFVPGSSAVMSPFAALSAVLVPSMQQASLFHQQQAAANAASAAKRRRLDQIHPGNPSLQPCQGLPLFAVAGMNAAALLSGQPLAAAAAQVMQQQPEGGVPPERRKKSQAQIDRRRERNRILARRTRLRKKFFFESLQKEVIDLQQENILLKELVRQNLKEANSKAILDECDAMEKMPPSVLEAIGEDASDIDPKDFSLVRSIQNSQHAFIITDPSLQDNPIVFASDEFCTMTGYTRDEVLGRNCRFLQGVETSSDKVKQIETAVKAGEDVSVTFVNYKSDGTPFWNKLFIAALRDAQFSIVNFIGVLAQVRSPPPDDPEYGKVLPFDGDKEDDDADEGDSAGEDE